MELKVGDLVTYKPDTYRRPRLCRVMELHGERVLLSRFGLHSITDPELKLVKSVTLPNLQKGDLVRIEDITSYEKLDYGCYWGSDMDNYVNKTLPVREVDYNDVIGYTATVGWYTFQTYHLTPVNGYDMI